MNGIAHDGRDKGYAWAQKHGIPHQSWHCYGCRPAYQQQRLMLSPLDSAWVFKETNQPLSGTWLHKTPSTFGKASNSFWLGQTYFRNVHLPFPSCIDLVNTSIQGLIESLIHWHGIFHILSLQMKGTNLWKKMFNSRPEPVWLTVPAISHIIHKLLAC